MELKAHARLAVTVTALTATGLLAAQAAQSPASATTVSAGRRPPRPAPTPTSTPTSTPAPTPSSSLAPGAAPTAVPASTTRRLLGTVTTTDNGSVTVNVAASGRFTLEYDTASAGGAFNNVVDGTFLQQSYLGADATGYSQTFFLSAGQHTIRLGGPQVDAPSQEFLDGTL